MNARTTILTMLGIALASGSAVQAATITVDGTLDGSCTLGRAVALANGPDATTDTFCVRVNDTPDVEDPMDTIVFASAMPDLIPLHALLSIRGPVIIDGGGRMILETDVRQRMFEIAAGASDVVTFVGITLQSDGITFTSGGVLVLSGQLVTSRTRFEANSSAFGGAVHVAPGASFRAFDSSFESNESRLATRSACSSPPIALGSAASFLALGGASVTNTGATIINGDLAVSPGTSITGFPPGQVTGTMHSADAVALQAQLDLVTAYDEAAGRTLCAVTPAADLAGSVLSPGIYKRDDALAIGTGTLVLDAEGDGDAVFIFQIGSTLTTATASQVLLINGARASNVYWQVGSSATLGTGSHFEGTLMALASVTAGTGASVLGRVLARNGSVTLDTNAIIKPPLLEGSGGTGNGGELGETGAAEGGAVDCFGTCHFERVLFANNIAAGNGPDGDAFGGAINAQGATVTIVNATFVGNRVLAGRSDIELTPTSAAGGAIASRGGSLDIVFSTFADNVADRDASDDVAIAAGGALFLVPSETSEYRLYASIVSGNSALIGPDCDTSGAANLLTQQSLFDDVASRADCDGAAASNLVGASALIGFGQNGGFSETVRFDPDSPALDHVADAACDPANGVDQRGFVRPSGAACDIGALELEDVSLDITGPTAHVILLGETEDQIVSMSYVITVPMPIEDSTFSITVSSGVDATVRDANGLAVAGCTVAGLTETCPFGALDPSERLGGIDFSFPASRRADIVWSGSIAFGFVDIEPADDSDSGVIVIVVCGDGVTTAPEVCDDGAVAGRCNATCTACEPGLSGVDCSVCVGLDDGNDCTTDTCDLVTGASHTNRVGSCNDDDACTTSDVCADGVCVGSGALSVDDANGCTTDSCDPASGAVHVDNSDPCNDGSVCTTSDVCSAGACVGSGALSVDDGDACTLDSCSPTTGAVHVRDDAACPTGLVESGGGGCAGGPDAGLAGLLVGMAALWITRRRVATRRGTRFEAAPEVRDGNARLSA